MSHPPRTGTATPRWPPRPGAGIRPAVGLLPGLALVVVLTACSTPAAGQPAAATQPAATSPSTSTVPATRTATTRATTPRTTPSGPQSLPVSTPVAAESGTDTPTTTDPTAPPAEPARDGVTQRHTFAPSSISLDVHGVDAASTTIETIDTTATGELSLPPNPGRVGWWQSGALAGEAYGSVVLAGHIDSRDQGIGFFARLLRVRPGDGVVLSDGTYQQRYRIDSTRDVPKASLATGTDTFSRKVAGRLVLLTCTGPFDPQTHYPDNLVVTAVPVGVATGS